MTLRVNPEFAALLAAATTTNIAWSSAFKSALGDTRRVICKRHADAGTPQENVYATGTTFRDAALTGPITIVGGIPTGYGVTSNLTTSLAADLNSGITILRIEGNGNWIEGTLGLTGSTCDFVFPANPTSTNSIAVAPNLRITPPPFLPSGTGFSPPALDADAPAYVIVDIGPDLDHLTEGGRIPFNRRIKNWVFEDAEYASNIGDVRITQSTEMVTYNDMEIGAELMSVDPQVGAVAGKVKHQVVGIYKPTEANWPGYPRMAGASTGGYRIGTRTMNGASAKYGISNTFPGPHRFRVMTADDRLLGIIDMPRDGTLINGSHLSEIPTATKPMRLHMHCASMVMWESHPSKLNSYAKKYFPGVDPKFLRPSLMKERASTRATYAPFELADHDQHGQWYAVDKWSYPANASATAAVVNTKDPYLFTTNGYALNTPAWGAYFGVQPADMGSAAYAMHLVQQWGYEPGSWSCHDQFSGPGGYRIDRAVIPDPIAIHMTDPAWVHLHDGASITEMVQHWNMAYFNHAIHWFTDVKNFGSIPTQEVLDGKWAHYQTYYGANVYTDVDHSIPMFVGAEGGGGASAPHAGAFVDTVGRLPWNGYSNDFFHNYSSPGWAALLYNSPAHALSQKMAYLNHILIQTNKTKAADFWKMLFIRSQAWWLEHEAMMWKLASDHPHGVSRAQVEARLEEALMGVYTNVHLPVFVNNDQSINSRCIRAFGLNVQDYGGTAGWGPISFTLHYYTAHALQLWRQFGLWKVMMDRSPQCKTALLLIIKMLDKGCIDYYLDTDGCYSGDVYGAGVNLFITDRTNPNGEVASSWADWLVRVNPKAGPLEDLVHKADGTVRGVDIGEWSRMQWPFIRQQYFGDIPAERDVNACCTKVAGWQKVLTDKIDNLAASGASPRSLTIADVNAHAALGRILPPTVLEP